MLKKPPLHIEPIRQWLMTYPGERTGIIFDIDGELFSLAGDTSDIPAHITQFPPSAIVGSDMIAPTNISNRFTKDTMGNTLVERKVQMQIYIRRFGFDDIKRLAVADFISDFLHWAAEETITGNAPKFGDTDRHKEQFEVTGGMKFSDVLDPSGSAPTGIEDYLFQLNITYFLFYDAQPLI